MTDMIYDDLAEEESKGNGDDFCIFQCFVLNGNVLKTFSNI